MYLFKELLILIFSCTFILSCEAAWGMKEEKKIKLKDIEVLTLYHGKMTAGRRSSPVPQLECVEGTAPCSAFKPKVVQCINRGSDGYNVQWECKTDMDNAYRFGDVEVSCEGYDYPDDPYVLHGSCGLKYSIDYTEEGLNRKKHNYYGNDHQSSYTTYGKKSSSSMSSIIADLIVYIGMGLIVYALYRTCTNSGRYAGQDAYSTTEDDYPSGGGGGGGGYGWFGGNNNQQPPPYNAHNRYNDDASCRNRSAHGGGTGTGGFWTGAATGGLLGYMFGK
ncbi:Store-operated calcium entry-associated regulatory factor [Armadillidium nasatum]|uniref:Store-operated calcium entry-associated regulatory factor n=1 Tax=Armadillidium nasatum TaxID=96803 RepID=A0A5N5TP97_9CRUS|nr:Store-operated calcium entry-associated regulatory factor [Armadillidium nasatum]